MVSGDGASPCLMKMRSAWIRLSSSDAGCQASCFWKDVLGSAWRSTVAPLGRVPTEAVSHESLDVDVYLLNVANLMAVFHGQSPLGDT